VIGRGDLVTKCLQIEEQVLHHLVPLLGILAERLANDALELGGNVRSDFGQRSRLVVQH
jgi:hypothetical protein